MVECKSIRKVFALKPIFMYGNVTGTHNRLNGPVPYPNRGPYVPYCLAICKGRGTHGTLCKEGVYGTKTTLVGTQWGHTKTELMEKPYWMSLRNWTCSNL